MKLKYSIYIILYTFIFVYMPPVLSFNLIHILTLVSFFSLMSSYKTICIKLIIDTLTRNLIMPMIIAMVYLLCVVLISQNSIVIIYPYLVITIEIPICVIYLCSYFIKHKYDIYDVLNILLIIGLIQGIVATLCFFIPSFKEIIENIVMKNMESDYVNRDIFLNLSKIRLNGLSTSMTFAMPVTQAILGLISLYLALNKNYKYILFMPILVFSAIINARNTFIVLIYGIILIILFNTKKPKTILKFLITVAIIIIVLPLFTLSISNTSQYVSRWISDGFNEISRFLQGDNIGYFEVVSNNFIRFPEGLSLIFGTGKSIFGLALGLGSDIGYINDIWLGGAVFATIIYFAYISYYIRAYKNSEKLIRFIALLFISTFLIINVKGSIVDNNEFINISILLSTVFIINKNSKLFKISDDNMEIK